ncbi:preprotein translocase subunit SecE [Candidatus Woesebacteria bacterium RIFCSPHIGHO2_02_FULL_42_20]|uniref:Protein translocase subunit SecE n=1 Tax=Candidatus Woesebacteria bacterium RIFCSPHIGHO2_12_FULL_41_24 TaxID=1802510 RepID=A0A1F8AT13_9BACT|nr:MAG: preprotein translocase subunit SecE [Candidatus Woesebacteria bacterium RBG_16_41_13]OGM29000.1 MAG: preprotein translocase subunit SecE [Candidatus Woesebacteria bacterium RIFCSPHIGHO2_01_FULL_42_80]OGM35158.1 MAG: preprotein translocase subunit SecE [Candidatus Woesebacteria bacterium RIFCSPHIGHO2_02_FULL_42_20]OGM54894.1 MAG: preprotein translocase subunit SecE [Candidatus Woesebacteria bacterium RIFCSPHIGHO2_12_FULL_41_24]OGM66661.1 MAG: preprotein translocase subunit SecE [Candidat
MKNTLGFLSEVKSEISKVTWPTRDEVTKLTLIVVAVSLIVGLYLGGLDYLFTKLLELIIYK